MTKKMINMQTQSDQISFFKKLLLSFKPMQYKKYNDGIIVYELWYKETKKYKYLYHLVPIDMTFKFPQDPADKRNYT